MERSSLLPIFLAIGAIAAGFEAIAAQAVQGSSNPLPTAAASVEFRSFERMSRQDRDLAANAESSISERASFDGLEFNQGKWNYQQIVCSALPGHVFLQFTRKNGAGDESLFSASIPRGGEGRVRIIPILRRSYSLFSPAPVNALTISAFNHILAEEGAVKTAGWLESGLCYAALAGAHPRTAIQDEQEPRMLTTATSENAANHVPGGVVISFTDMSAAPRPMEWILTFDGKGRLLKATHITAQLSHEKLPKQKPEEGREKPVQAAGAEKKAQPVTAKNAAVKPIVRTPGFDVKPIQRKPVDVQGKPVQTPDDVNGKTVKQ